MSAVEHCLKATNNKCSQCADGYEPSNDGLSCNEIVKDYTLIIALSTSLGSLLILIIVVIIIIIRSTDNIFHVHKAISLSL